MPDTASSSRPARASLRRRLLLLSLAAVLVAAALPALLLLRSGSDSFPPAALPALLLWIAAVAGLAALAISRQLKRFEEALQALNRQALELHDGHYKHPASTKTEFADLAPLSASLARLAAQLETRASEHSAQLAQHDHRSGHDTLTGLAKRARFLQGLDQALRQAADRGRPGSLALLRVPELGALNKQLGRAATDRFLTDLAARLQGLVDSRPERSAARLNGSDFALIAPDLGEASRLSGELSTALAALESLHGKPLLQGLPIGAIAYSGNESQAQLLARLDGVLAAAELTGRGPAHVADPRLAVPELNDLAAWRTALEEVLATAALRLGRFPVINATGQILHFEAPVQACIDGQWYCADAFLPWIERLDLSARLDLATQRLALERIEAEEQPLNINVSASSLRAHGFMEDFVAALQQRPQAAPQLWVEVPEQGVVQDLARFRTLCQRLRPLGCRLGIEHSGRQFGQLGGLHDCGLHYVKIDARLLRQLDRNAEHHGFAQRIVTLAQAIGLQVIAQGVDRAEELAALRELGFDGMTGKAVQV